MKTALQIRKLDATFGAVLSGVAVNRLDEDTFEQIYQLWLEHALLIFPGQHLSNEDQIAFAGRFGELEFDLAPLSNVRSDGSLRVDSAEDGIVQILKGNMGWHADSTYMPVQAKGAVFTAHVTPKQGGETGWADMRAAYEALDETTRERLETLSAFHSLYYSQAKLGHIPEKADSDSPPRDPEGYNGYGFHDQGPPQRPLIKIHPETGRASLQIGRHAYGIPGMGVEESEELLAELLDFACRPPRVHYHSWTPGDAVVWDNRRLLHRATPWDMTEPRVMYHSRIAGDSTSEFAPSANGTE